MDAALLRAEIDRLYVMWGVRGVSGLRVDGAEATPELLAEAGPEDVIPRGAGGGAAGDGAERGRKKKLIVAFHFQFSNQAGWKCDACRRSGLERERRCGWLGWPHDGRARLRCGRGRRVALDELPEVVYHGGERSAGGGISGAAAARRHAIRGVERAAGGGVRDSGAGFGGGVCGERSGSVTEKRRGGSGGTRADQGVRPGAAAPGGNRRGRTEQEDCFNAETRRAQRREERSELRSD